MLIAHWFRQYGLVLSTYLLVMWLTKARFMGDSIYYVDNIMARLNEADAPFWEFGHLIWRPTGWLLTQTLMPVTRWFVGSELRVNVMLSLMIITWLSGLLSALLLRCLVRQVCQREWVANVAAIALLCSQAVLNYSQSGTSYVPGLAMILLGLYLAARNEAEPRSIWTGVGAGAALAFGVFLWAPYIWAIPATLVSPLLLFSADRKRWRLVLIMTGTCALVGMLSYGLVLAHLGIHDVAGIRAWIVSASHGIERGGVARAVFGLARSWIDMGTDGVIFKRYLALDPFSPVSWTELLRPSLWKLGLFYLACGALSLNLLYSARGRQIFALLSLNALPVLLFAIFWEGGAIERYLPLYPILFLALASSLVVEGAHSWLKIITLIFVITASATNLVALSAFVLDRHQEAVVSRVMELLPQLKPGSVLVVSHMGDELVNFKDSFPFHPINRQGPLKVYPLVSIRNWPQRYAGLIERTWREGADVWISRRLLAARPRAEWRWVEGDYGRLSWTSLNKFITQFELGRSVGGDDGFALLLRCPKNEEILRYSADAKQFAASGNVWTGEGPQ